MKEIGWGITVIGFIIAIITMGIYDFANLYNGSSPFLPAIKFCLSISPIAIWCLFIGTWDFMAEKSVKGQ